MKFQKAYSQIPLKNLMEELEKMTGSDSFSDELLEAISDLTDDDDELDIISEDLEAILLAFLLVHFAHSTSKSVFCNISGKHH